jgi:hypothetical protein
VDTKRWALLPIVAAGAAFLLACGTEQAPTPAPTVDTPTIAVAASPRESADTVDATDLVDDGPSAIPAVCYDDEVLNLLADLSDAQNAVADSFERADPLSEDWKADLRAKLLLLAAFHERVLKLEAPPKVKAANDALIQAAFELRDAADRLEAAVTSETDDASMFTRSGETIADALGRMVSAVSEQTPD